MKTVEFKNEDIAKENESLKSLVQELKAIADSKELELEKAQNKIKEGEQAQKISDKLKKKNEVNELVIVQLKKELENQAYKVL